MSFRLLLLPVTLLSAVAFAQTYPQAWTPFAKLNAARRDACAVGFSPGQVLIAGGIGADGAASNVAEILNADGVSRVIPGMREARVGHTCTTLEDGRVLVTGGVFTSASSSAEVYHPDINIWIPVASAGPMRAGSAAVRLRDGRVLVTGGYREDGTLVAYSEVFDPNSNRFTASRGQLNQPRRNHSASLLGDGRAVITGGIGLDGTLKVTEFYDAVTGVIWTGPNMTAARERHAAVSLEDGRVLIASSGTLEVLDAAGLRWTSLPTAKLKDPSAVHSAVVIPGNGDVLFVSNGKAERFHPADASIRAIDDSAVYPGAKLAVLDDGTIVALGGEVDGAPQAEASIIAFPAISFQEAVSHPGDMVRISGRNLPADQPVQYKLEFFQTALGLSDAPQFRVVTARSTATSDGMISDVPLFIPFANEVGRSLRLTATLADGTVLVRNSPIKYKSELELEFPPSTVQGQSTALTVRVKPVAGAPTPLGPMVSTFGPVTFAEMVQDSRGVSYSSSRLPAGALAVTVLYVGDSLYDRAVARTSLGVASRQPVVDIVSTVATPQLGVAFDVFVQVRVDSASVAGAPPITGPVNIYESGVFVGQARQLSSSTSPFPMIQASLPFTAMNFNTLRFTATYAGDGNYLPASSAVLTPFLQRAQPSMTLSGVPSIFNQTVKPNEPLRFHCGVPVVFDLGLMFPSPLDLTSTGFTLFAKGPDGVPYPVSAGDFARSAPGKATARTEATLRYDTIRLTASYAGDAYFRPAMSAELPVEQIPLPMAVKLVDTPKTFSSDGITVFTAEVTTDADWLLRVAGSVCDIPGPTGYIEFYDETGLIGAIPIDDTPDQVKRAQVRAYFPPGDHTVYMRYTGDARHAPIQSAPATFHWE